MTPTTTQDLIQALRTGPAVTLATNAAADRLEQLERERDWLKDCMATLERENAELKELDAACGRAHQALSDVGIACGPLDERVRAATDLLRWRKQSEEPAPDGIDLLECLSDGTAIASSYSPIQDSHWRPIGPLPEPQQ